jgi:hypothetical protein
VFFERRIFDPTSHWCGLLTKKGDIALLDSQHDEHSDAGEFNEGMVPLADDEDEKAVHDTNVLRNMETVYLLYYWPEVC